MVSSDAIPDANHVFEEIRQQNNDTIAYEDTTMSDFKIKLGTQADNCDMY